jgi:hypothetical protein
VLRLLRLTGAATGCLLCAALATVAALACLTPEERAAFGDRDWRAIYVDALGWDEIDRRINFGRYDVIVLLDFGLEPIDDIAVLEFFDFTQTPVEIVPASLDRFRDLVLELVDG